MRDELEKKLYEKYPKLFRQTALPESQSCMFYGITCGDGWNEILSTLCNLIQWRVDQQQKENPDYPQVEFAQIKEKFGGLRVYTEGNDDYVNGIIDFACSMADKTCENCGLPGKLYNGGWMVTQCEACSKLNEDEDE